MTKQAVFTMKIEPELRDEFMAETRADHRPASQVLRELMREYIERRKKEREYDDYLRRKVELGRASMTSGEGIPDDEVESGFAKHRAEAAKQQ